MVRTSVPDPADELGMKPSTGSADAPRPYIGSFSQRFSRSMLSAHRFQSVYRQQIFPAANLRFVFSIELGRTPCGTLEKTTEIELIVESDLVSDLLYGPQSMKQLPFCVF